MVELSHPKDIHKVNLAVIRVCVLSGCDHLLNSVSLLWVKEVIDIDGKRQAANVVELEHKIINLGQAVKHTVKR